MSEKSNYSVIARSEATWRSVNSHR